MRQWNSRLALNGVVVLLAAWAPARAQEPQARATPRRPSAEVVKKYDKNGDGRLDAAERAAARVESAGAVRTPGTAPAEPTVGGSTAGILPLTEMSGQDRYKGEDGGLYGGGGNEAPREHQASALHEAALVVPRDPEGKPDPNGKIALVALGMSNTSAEFSRFMQLANSVKAPHMVLVDGAQLGRTAREWAYPEKSRRPRAGSPWLVLDERISEAGVTARQVQVVWIKQAEAFPGGIGEFPKHSAELRNNLARIVVQLKERFPNLRLAYLSSRIYGGYAEKGICPEPFAFEGAFAVRGLIRAQIQGDEDLNCDPQRGSVHAPVLLWGPYLWANGDQPRIADGLTWARGDFRDDGTHPSTSGADKVGGLLLKFLQTDPTARTWFLK